MGRLIRKLPLSDLIARREWLKLCVVLGIAGLVALLPLILGFDSRIVNVTLFVAIYAILALGLNVVVGYVGLLDLGYVTFLATGAILSMDLLLLTSSDTGWVVPVGTTEVVTGAHPFAADGAVFLIIAIAGLVCALLGVLRGIPTLKLTGDYYAIVTLGIAEIVYLVYLNTQWLTGGAYGIKLRGEHLPRLFGARLYYDTWQFYYLVMVGLLVTIVILDRLNHSRIGRAWAAIRLDETAARACGVNVSRYKMIAFAVSGFFGGVGGALFAIWIGTVAVKALDVWQSILILCAVVLGGMGSIRGVLLGSVILFSLRELLREQLTIGDLSLRVPPEASFLVYGLLLVFIMRFRPQGVLPSTATESHAVGADQEEALRGKQAQLYVLQELVEDHDGA
ncbi:branched-chain amino acid ABC transporter permease [Planctomycetota bacterium]